MITRDDVIAANPTAEQYTPEQMDPFLEAANLGLPDSRFKNPALADRGRVTYVMHMLTKPALNLNAPHIRAQLATPKAKIKKPSPWDGTPHGVALKKMVVNK
jgi:hypothetical protein